MMLIGVTVLIAVSAPVPLALCDGGGGTVSQGLTKLARVVAKSASQVDDLRGRVKALEDDQLKERLDKIEESVSAIERDIDSAMRSSLSAIDKKLLDEVRGIHLDLDSLRKKLSVETGEQVKSVHVAEPVYSTELVLMQWWDRGRPIGKYKNPGRKEVSFQADKVEYQLVADIAGAKLPVSGASIGYRQFARHKSGGAEKPGSTGSLTTDSQGVLSLGVGRMAVDTSLGRDSFVTCYSLAFKGSDKDALASTDITFQLGR